MKNKYMILKLNEKEVKELKNILLEVVGRYICEQSQPDFDEKVIKEYEKYSKMHRKYNYGKKILDIIEYLERK